jgi:hypothetical protein
VQRAMMRAKCNVNEITLHGAPDLLPIPAIILGCHYCPVR